MDHRDPLTLRPQLGAYIFSLLFLFTGVFSFRKDLLGKTFPGMFATVETTVDADTLAMAETPVVPPSVLEEVLRNPRKVKPLPLEQIDAETLWLARCMYSETKRPVEQELVGWVVRNRVETAYRDKNSYRDVVLDDYQFSAFTPNTRKRRYYSTLQVHSQAPGWKNTLYLAYYVRHADPTFRPFSTKTRHFYSERSMRGQDHPDWVSGMQPVTPTRPHLLDARRFRFYEGIF